METQPYQELERWRVRTLELRRKIDKLIFDFVEALDDEAIQKIKARNHATGPVSGGSARFVPADEPEGTDVPDPDKQSQVDKSGGPEKHV